jgi:hypothetical protein
MKKNAWKTGKGGKFGPSLDTKSPKPAYNPRAHPSSPPFFYACKQWKRKTWKTKVREFFFSPFIYFSGKTAAEMALNNGLRSACKLFTASESLLSKSGQLLISEPFCYLSVKENLFWSFWLLRNWGRVVETGIVWVFG